MEAVQAVQAVKKLKNRHREYMENIENVELFKVIPEDYEKLKGYFMLRFSGTCENNIMDTYIWKDYYNTEYFHNDVGIMWVYDNKEEVFSTTPLARRQDLQECFDDLKEYFNKVLNKKLTMYVVDEDAVNSLNLPEDEFIVEEDRRYFDYVYDADELRKLAGKKFHKKKNHLNSFLKEYDGRYEFRMLTCCNYYDIVEFLDNWEEVRGIQDEYNRVDYEVNGIKYVLKHCNKLKFRMCGVYIAGKMEAFSLGSYIKTEKTAYIHVEKANPEIRGLYAYINQQFIIQGFPEAEKVNREDDMGREGLRQAKMTYNPIELVKKYSIIQK